MPNHLCASPLLLPRHRKLRNASTDAQIWLHLHTAHARTRDHVRHLPRPPPSANSACTRCVLKCAGIEHEEVNAYGQTRTPEYIAKFITNLAPAIEHDGACVSETNAIGTPRVSRSHSWTHRPHVSGTHHSDAQPSPRDLTQISSRGVA